MIEQPGMPALARLPDVRVVAVVGVALPGL
jgi:hypothetical protein